MIERTLRISAVDKERFFRLGKIQLPDNIKIAMKMTLMLIYALFLNLNVLAMSVFALVTILIMLLISPKMGLMLFLYTVVVSPDTLSNVVGIIDVDSLFTNSIYLNNLGGLTYITYLNLLIFGLAVLFFNKVRINRILFFSLLIPFIVPLFGIITNFSSVSSLKTDLRYFIIPVGVYSMLYLTKVKNDQLLNLLNYALLSKALSNIIITTIKFGSPFNLVYWGSASWLFSLLLLLNIDKNIKVFCFLLIVVLVNLMMFPTRGRMFCLVYALTIVFIYGRRSHRILCVTGVVFAIALITTIGFAEISGAFFRVFVFKLTSINIFVAENTSANLRLLEFLNIFVDGAKNIYPILIGSGYGGSYTDSFIPFDGASLLGGDAFPDEWITNRIFYDGHGHYNFMLLKSGPILTAVFYGGLCYFAFLKKNLYERREKLILTFLPIIGIIMVKPLIIIIFTIFLYMINSAYASRTRVQRI